MSELTIPNLMTLLPDLFQPQRALGITAAINFVLSGPEGSDWAVNIRNQECAASPGKLEPADLTFNAEASDILAIFTGRLDPARALLSGKLRISGDMRLAMALTELFNTHDPRLRQWKQ